MAVLTLLSVNYITEQGVVNSIFATGIKKGVRNLFLSKYILVSKHIIVMGHNLKNTLIL